jgi:hypothetical protein
MANRPSRYLSWELPMDWVVAVSAGEIASGALSPEAERDAHAAFREHGCVLLRGAFPRPAIEAMFNEYVARYGALNAQGMQDEAAKPPPNRFLNVGDARYEITLRLSGAFAAPDVIANRLLRRFLGPLLGDDMLLSGVTAVVSHPGATLQHVHRDYSHLFTEPGVGSGLPVYAVNAAVPLIDVDIETGPTGVWLGSHRWASNVVPQRQTMTACPFQRGDCVLLDYRTLHTGLPNLSGRIRPIVYMVYTRPWFFDEVNHVNRISLDMPLDQYDQLPQSDRPLLTRAFSQATRARWHEADARGRAPLRDVNDPSTWGKVGRNDPCACGSGKKFKQCHGRST